MVFESLASPSEKVSFELERRHMNKSGLLVGLMEKEESKTRRIGVIRIKMDFPAVIFQLLYEYLVNENRPTSEWDEEISAWEKNWLSGVDTFILIDVLAAASHLKMDRLCFVLFYFSDMRNLVPVEDDAFSNDERARLETIC